MSNTTQNKYLYQHTSQETAYVVQDYPWGFRLRTTIRYWIETREGKVGGQRFVSQTINPKTGAWCAPKYTTYSPIMIMYLDENEHIKYSAISVYSSEEILKEFKETHWEHLNEFQKDQLRWSLAQCEVMKHVTVTIKPSGYGMVSLLSKDPLEVAKRELIEKEQEERKAEQAKEDQKINRAIAYHYHKSKNEGQ
jgi:hypothetical protein